MTLSNRWQEATSLKIGHWLCDHKYQTIKCICTFIPDKQKLLLIK